MSLFRLAIIRCVTAAALVFGTSVICGAQTRVWSGGGAPDPSWTNPANWGGTAPNPLDELTFSTATFTTSNNNTPTGTQYTSIAIDVAAPTYNLTGNAITAGGDIADSSPNPQTITFPLILADNRVVNVFDPGGSLSLNGLISSPGGGFGLRKIGPGMLTLRANNTYTGATVLDGGTLAYAVDNSNVAGIAFGVTPTADTVSTTASALNLTNANVTTTSLVAQTNNAAPAANTIAIGAGKTLTVNGPFTVGVSNVYTNLFPGVRTALNVSGDTLTVNGGANLFRVGLTRANTGAGADPVTFLDLSALSHFNFTGTNHFRVGNGNSRAEMNLANTSNLITAAQVRVGDSGQDAGGTGGSDNNNAGRSIMRLGAGTNVINTDLLIVGRTKSGGTVEFQGATGTLVMAGQAGGASTANIQIGSSDNATGSGDVNMLSLAGHNATVQGGNVVIGQLAGGGGGNSARGIVTFDTGTFNANSLRLGVNSSGASTNGATGTFTLGGDTPGSGATGVLNVTGQFFLAQRTNTTTTAGRSTGTFTINGGTANIGTDILDASTTISTAGPNVTTLTLDGGTLNMMMGHNIGSYAAPITNVNLNSGNLNSPAIIAGNTITLMPAVTINGAPTYILADGGTMTSSLPTLTLQSNGGLEGGGALPGTVNGDIVAAAGSRIAPGSNTAAGTLQFNNNLSLNNGSTVRFKLSENTVGNDQIGVSGNLTAAGTVNLDIDALGIGPQTGNTYTLFNYSGTLSGNQTNYAVGGALAESRLTFSVVPTLTTPGTIQLFVGGSGPMDLIWSGTVSNKWNLVGDANWQGVPLSPQRFFTLDRVTFDDSPTNMSDVELVGQLRPGSVTVNAARNYTFTGAGQIIGSTSLTKSGAGTLVLANPNSYSGTTSITAGTLQVGNGGTTGSLGTGPVPNDGILIVNRSDALTVANVIGGTGEVRQAGTGRLTLSGVNTYTGPTNITAGAIVVTDETSLGDAAGGPVTISSGAALDLTGSTTANGVDFGAKQFRIVGAGVGGTGVLTNSGTVGQQNAFEQVVLTGNATVGGTGRFDIRGDTSMLNLAGFTLTKVGPNQVTLVGTSVTAGNIVVNEGIFSMETTTSVSNIGAVGTITYNAGSTAQFFNLTGDVSRPMTVNGAVTMGNASAAAQPSTVSSNITLNGDMTVTNLNNSAGALTLAGVISGAGSLTKNGPTTLNLNGANTYTGTTTINDGVLHVGGSISSNNAVTVAAPATFEVQGVASSVGAISGAGVTKVGDGTLPTVLTAGQIRQSSLDIAAISKVTTRPGSATSVLGALSFAVTNEPSATFDLTNSALVLDYPAAGPNPAFDTRQQIIVGRGGTGLGKPWNGAGITSSTAQADVAASPNSRSIGYAVNSDLPLGALTTFRGQAVDPSSVLIRYTRTADANLDGVVNDDDVTVVGTFYAPGVAKPEWAKGDFDYNGFVDDDDVTLLGVFYNPAATPIPSPAADAAAGASGVAAVPEPATFVLLLISICIAAICRLQCARAKLRR